MLRRLLIIVPIVVVLTLVGLFMPAQRVSIEGVGTLSFETTVALSVGSEVAYAQPDTGKAESNFNVYSSPETVDDGDGTYTIKLSGENILIGQKNILIGQKASSTFKPTVTLNRWGNEASMDIGLPNIILSRATLSDGIISTEDDSYKVNIYGLTDLKAKSELGGLEFELVLKRKPPTNSFSFNLNLNNLVAYYQPPLTQEYSNGWSDEFSCNITVTETEVTDAKTGEVLVHRPENIVGSYAVYHANKKDHIRGQTNYMAGKAFHIYRPHLVDAVDEKTWADLKIADGKLVITIDKAWLDGATYPVVIDPTFGYTTKGGSSSSQSSDYIVGSWATGAAGEATSMSVYWAQYFSYTPNLKYALYTKTSGTAGSFLAGTAEWTLTSGWNNWKELTFSSPPTISATDYWLLFWYSARVYYYRDSAASGKSGYLSRTYGSWPDPISLSNQSYIYSIYCTYIPSISNTPASKAFGTVAANSSYWSNGGSGPVWPLDNGECYFTVTNQGSGPGNISIKANTFSGGVGWTLASSPGQNIVTLKAGKSGDATEANMVTLTTSDLSFITGLGAGLSKKWEIKLETGTFTDSVEKTSIITLTATL